MLDLRIEKIVEDVRGKLIVLSYGNKRSNVVEIKKGFSRGGHYHKFEQIHLLIIGKIEYKEENLVTHEEQIRIISAPSIIQVSPQTPHLFTALEDTVFIEIFDEPYEAVNYTKYRKMVEDKMMKETGKV